MSRRNLWKVLLVVAVLGAALPCLAASPNVSVPGELLVDNPTIHNLAFRWLLSGDANANATAAVRYRAVGEKQWRSAHPLLRVRHVSPSKDGAVAGPILAGSILDLPAATSYEVELTFSDPDGGKGVKAVTVATRNEPADEMPGRRTMHVYPESHAGRRDPGYASLVEAFAKAQPGDLVWIHPGTYAGPLTVTASGKEGDPILFRGVEGAIIDGGGGNENSAITLAKGSDYLQFEHLSIQSGRVGIRGEGNRGIVIRRCRITDCAYGIAISGNPHWANIDWYVGDNVLIGRYTAWNLAPGDRVSANYGAGISLAGRGHVICHNEVRFFLDGISTGHVKQEDMKPDWAVLPDAAQHAIDICNNDVRQIVNAGISADRSFSNIRIMRNRVLNSVYALSVRANFSGPVYFLRNATMNHLYHPWRLAADPTGVLLYHNSTVSYHPAVLQEGTGHNTHVRNNILLGEELAKWQAGSAGESTFDYNAYFPAAPPDKKKGGEQVLIQWVAPDGKQQNFPTLEEFAKGTKQETHGLIMEATYFAGGHMRLDYPIYRSKRKKDWLDSTEGYSTDRFDLRLKAESPPVDAGEVLANINHDLMDVPQFVQHKNGLPIAYEPANDNYTGKAPDLGALEVDKPAPHYGPRPAMTVPNIAQFYGIGIRVYIRDGEPQFRAFYGAYSGLFDLKTLEMLEGDLPKTAQGLARQWAEQNRGPLQEIWSTKQYKELPGLE